MAVSVISFSDNVIMILCDNMNTQLTGEHKDRRGAVVVMTLLPVGRVTCINRVPVNSHDSISSVLFWLEEDHVYFGEKEATQLHKPSENYSGKRGSYFCFIIK